MSCRRGIRIAAKGPMRKLSYDEAQPKGIELPLSRPLRPTVRTHPQTRPLGTTQFSLRSVDSRGQGHYRRPLSLSTTTKLSQTARNESSPWQRGRPLTAWKWMRRWPRRITDWTVDRAGCGPRRLGVGRVCGLSGSHWGGRCSCRNRPRWPCSGFRVRQPE